MIISEKDVYICEDCLREFDTEEECREHELTHEAMK